MRHFLRYLSDVSPLYLLAWVLALLSISAVVVVCPLTDVPLTTVLALITAFVVIGVVLMVAVMAVIALGMCLMALLGRGRRRSIESRSVEPKPAAAAREPANAVKEREHAPRKPMPPRPIPVATEYQTPSRGVPASSIFQ